MQQELTFLKILQLYSPDPEAFRDRVRSYLQDDAGFWGYDSLYPYLFNYMRGSSVESLIDTINTALPFKKQKSTYIKRLSEIASKLDFSMARSAYHIKKSSRIELGGLTMKIPQNIQYVTSDGPKMLVALFDKNSGLDEGAIRLALGILNEEVNSSALGDGLTPELICFDDDILNFSSVTDLHVAGHDEVMEWYSYCLKTLRDFEVHSIIKHHKRPKVDPDQLGLDL